MSQVHDPHTFLGPLVVLIVASLDKRAIGDLLFVYVEHDARVGHHQINYFLLQEEPVLIEGDAQVKPLLLVEDSPLLPEVHKHAKQGRRGVLDFVLGGFFEQADKVDEAMKGFFLLLHHAFLLLLQRSRFPRGHRSLMHNYYILAPSLFI